ncbi:MAG TPA: S1C family serine protease [Stellaceae bacterium]|nr:S1C family serine protease [Stellaceae bacterium]
MTETPDPLTLLSNRLADLTERASASILTVRGGGRWPTSGIHWRPGIVVTAEEALERDDGIEIVTADGRKLAATLAGRDPSTDIAVLKIAGEGLPVATLGDAATLRTGNLVLAIGRHERGALAASGIVAMAGGAWHSARGGAIDHLIRLDLRLAPSAEGGALVDTQGQTLGMAVTGPRRRALAIPRSTIDRVVDQLLAKGRIARGYLGAGLRPVGQPAGVLVMSLDPEGPAAQAKLLVGDIIQSWNGKSVTRVREVMHLLTPESVGSQVELGLLRGGAPASLRLAIAERPAR